MHEVMSYLEERLSRGKVHMTLLDPDSQSAEEAGAMAAQAKAAGTDAIMLGGSTGITQEKLDRTVLAIKEAFGSPIILFPSGASGITPHADAIYFMSMLNSIDPRFLVGEQVKGAPYVRHFGIEPLPMGYLVIEPGMTVGKVGKADLIGREDHERAVAYALCAQYFGMRLVYLEAGSGATMPVKGEMVAKVKEALDIPLIVGGGIRDAGTAGKLAAAGGDIIVTGTVVEDTSDIESVLTGIITAIKE